MIVVTGGAGFIGCNLIKGLNKIQQKNILVVDHLKNGRKYINLKNLDILDYLDKNYFIKRLFDNFINSYIKDIDVVFHEGACSSTAEWDGNYMMRNNYQYSKDLLNYCVKYNIPFIYASSAAVYGKDTRMIDKIHQFKRPINIYGYSKFLFDQYVRTVFPKINSQICGLRYFNVYGPYEFHKGKMASIVFLLYNQIMHGKYPTLFIGSKYFKRDFIYVDDIVDINIWVWNNHISGILDCGTGRSHSFEYIANVVLKFFNKNLLRYIPLPKKLYENYQIFTQANVNQLRELGYEKLFINIKDGIYKYLSWLKYNK